MTFPDDHEIQNGTMMSIVKATKNVPDVEDLLGEGHFRNSVERYHRSRDVDPFRTALPRPSLSNEDEEEDAFFPMILPTDLSRFAGRLNVHGGEHRILPAVRSWDYIEIRVRGYGDTTIDLHLMESTPELKLDCSSAKGHTQVNVHLYKDYPCSATYTIRPGDTCFQQPDNIRLTAMLGDDCD